MKVCVLGLWHLGTVTAACLAAGGHDVTGLDFDPARRRRPGGRESAAVRAGAGGSRRGRPRGRLAFASPPTPPRPLADADVVWVTYDTPVDDDDRADVESVVERAGEAVSAPARRRAGPGLVAAAGRHDAAARAAVRDASRRAARSASAIRRRTCGSARRSTSSRTPIAWSPACARRADRDEGDGAAAALHRPNRVDVGRIGGDDQARAQRVPGDLGHVHQRDRRALRAGRRGRDGSGARTEVGGAHRAERLPVAGRGVRRRHARARRGVSLAIGPGAWSGDAPAVVGQVQQRRPPALGRSSVCRSCWGAWPAGRSAVWGLTYKPGTDTLRRSSAVELCRWLHAQGARVRAHDPAVRALPAGLAAHVELTDSAAAAADGASALVVATPWPEYRDDCPERRRGAHGAAAGARCQPLSRRDARPTRGYRVRERGRSADRHDADRSRDGPP